MDLRQLRYFVAVVESGSFTRAAGLLHVAQPALSQHVRHMEEELGIVLLHRGAYGVKATEAGERLRLHASAILEQFAEIPDSVRGVAMAPRGEVRFGMSATVGELLAVPLIETARARYPDIRIRIVEAMSGYVLNWLRSGETDLAMLYSDADPQGLSLHHALSEEICLFGTHGLADSLPRGTETIPMAAVAALPLIMPGPGHGLRMLIDNAAVRAGTLLAPTVETDAYSQIKMLVGRELGFGMLSRAAVQGGVHAGIFRTWRVVDPPITRHVYLAHSTERPLLNASRAIGQLAWSILRDLVRSGAWVARLPDGSKDPGLF